MARRFRIERQDWTPLPVWGLKVRMGTEGPFFLYEPPQTGHLPIWTWDPTKALVFFKADAREAATFIRNTTTLRPRVVDLRRYGRKR